MLVLSYFMKIIYLKNIMYLISIHSYSLPLDVFQVKTWQQHDHQWTHQLPVLFLCIWLFNCLKSFKPETCIHLKLILIFISFPPYSLILSLRSSVSGLERLLSRVCIALTEDLSLILRTQTGLLTTARKWKSRYPAPFSGLLWHCPKIHIPTLKQESMTKNKLKL